MNKKQPSNSEPRSNTNSPLSKEDLELWNRFKRSIEPLSDRDRNRVDQSVRDSEFYGGTDSRKENDKSAGPQSRKIDRKSQSDTSQLDRKRVRRIRSGRIALQARLDLHGMRQDQAYVSLRNFLHRCQAEGLSTVLVITGKGKSESPEEREIWDDRDRGVLRRVVPEWLAQSEFRDLILGYNTASERHGGSGALYINIRRLK